MTFARHQFELSQPQEDGTPLLTHLQAASEKTGVLHPKLANAPKVPAGCDQLWRDFLELHYSRAIGFGIQRISFLDLYAWQKVRGVRLEAWEIECIRKADSIYIAEFAAKPEKTN